MPPHGIIFDCDGTLADTMPLHYDAWVATLTRHGLALDEDRFYALGGWPTQRVIELLIAEAQASGDAARIAHEKEAGFTAVIDQVLPIDVVVEVARIHRGRTPLAVATGGSRPICERILRQIGCFDWFDAVVTCEDVATHKPDPEIFLEAARQIAIAPQHCLVYEDTEPGLEAARRAGMQAIDVRTLHTPRRRTA